MNYYLLDTNVCIRYINQKDSPILCKFATIPKIGNLYKPIEILKINRVIKDQGFLNLQGLGNLAPGFLNLQGLGNLAPRFW